MSDEFENWLLNYVIRDGSVIRTRYAKQLIGYLNKLQNEEKIDLNEEWNNDKLQGLLKKIEQDVINGNKNKNTAKGDITAVNKFIEFKTISSCGINTTK